MDYSGKSLFMTKLPSAGSGPMMFATGEVTHSQMLIHLGFMFVLAVVALQVGMLLARQYNLKRNERILRLSGIDPTATDPRL